jgi:hypothetical protein
MNFKEIVCEDVYWIQLAHVSDHWRADVKTAMKLQFPQEVVHFLLKVRLFKKEHAP